MATTQMHQHLRQYAEDGIQQKVRLTNTAISYDKQVEKSRERVIDQTTLENKMRSEGISSERIDLVVERKMRDQEILDRVSQTLNDTLVEVDGLTKRMNAHVEELSEIEIVSGGFVTHPIGVDKGAVLDPETMTVKFETDGHVEIPIGVRLNRWKDSSQLTIKKIKKAGV
jgi:hypothetical protein